MDQAPYHLDQVRRDAVLEAIQEVCAHRGWTLPAAHGCVRTACAKQSRAHSGSSRGAAERVMSDFKTYSSRRLNRMRLDKPNRKRWARHGSTRWLWKPQHVSAAIQYAERTPPCRRRAGRLNRSARHPLPNGRGSERRYAAILHFYVAHPRSCGWAVPVGLPLGGAVLADAHVSGDALFGHRSGEHKGEHVTVRRQGTAQLDSVAIDLAL